MKIKFIIIFIILASLSNCGIYFKYVKTKQISPIKLYNQNTGIIDIDIPVYLMEKSVTLKENLYNDITTVLKKNKINIRSIRKLQNEEIDTKLFKNDLYNWFFRSDSFKSDKINAEFDLSNVDYLLGIEVLKFESGTTLNNSWIKMVINIYKKDKMELKNIITYEGFYKYVKQEMYKTLR